MKRIHFTYLLACLNFIIAFSQNKELILDNNWTFSQKGKNIWRKAQVPGCVHTDLMANKIIPDPFLGDNEKDLQWIEKEDWEYKTNFKINKSDLQNDKIEIVFGGLDTYAKVFLNNQEILVADNMFRSWTIDVKPYLKEGVNSLYILFESAVKGPNEITRFNLYTSSSIKGVPASGYTSGDAINAIREVAKETLPKGYDIAWEGLSYDETRRGNEAIYIFLVVIVFVYLVLAAQYESFIIPLAVLLSLPPGIFGSFLLLKMMGLANDIYAQMGLIMLLRLLGKNAILIVEFAVQKNQQGATVLESAIEGATVRFRPILMTSFAFIAGLVPLVVATGPGAVGNRTIGSSALGGMIFGTIFGVVIVPGLYFIFGSLAEGRTLIKDEEITPLSEDFVEGQSSGAITKRIKKIMAKIMKNNEK